MKLINIAIDGPAGAGKSSVAKTIAKNYDILYLDTGSLYRAVGFFMLSCGDLYGENFDIRAHLAICNLKVKYDGGRQHIFVCGKDVTDYIRTSEIAMAASYISCDPNVREYLLKIERAIAKNNSVVMDGRDIGTVVLPDANVKIFLTASLRVRALRRFEELSERGLDVTYDQILKDVEKRDLQDSERKIAPLRPAKDAKIVDTSNLTLKETIETVTTLINKFSLEEQFELL